MNTNQLRQLFSDSGNDTILEMNDVVELGQHVKIDTKIDKSTLDYYYSINIMDLAKSGISDDMIYDMINKGWTLNKSKTEIVKYC